ncbi:hypothetical protein JCM15548_1538 [Geofilum rubicundum JCM 15548]|uniref:Uncharacterized protein n=1 Tax=Geofilum rubicundum JCM 15548 TaxID=1236989 RepID=A0A0E9LS96_9BACT|nr:hypothetical protein JCM15548_1538 [Geofilum rubicundum JCM 15548]
MFKLLFLCWLSSLGWGFYKVLGDGFFFFALIIINHGKSMVYRVIFVMEYLITEL